MTLILQDEFQIPQETTQRGKKNQKQHVRRIMCDSNDKTFMNNSIPQEETEREIEELEKNHVQFQCQSS
jgi:hypothetical protein